MRGDVGANDRNCASVGIGPNHHLRIKLHHLPISDQKSKRLARRIVTGELIDRRWIEGMLRQGADNSLPQRVQPRGQLRRVVRAADGGAAVWNDKSGSI